MTLITMEIHPRVFPVFDLGLLDPPFRIEDEHLGLEPKAAYTYTTNDNQSFITNTRSWTRSAAVLPRLFGLLLTSFKSPVLFQALRHQPSADREFICVALNVYVVDERLKACERIYPTRASILSKYSPRMVIGRFSSPSRLSHLRCPSKHPFQPQDAAAADGKMDMNQ